MSGIEDKALHARADEVYDAWAPGHADGKVMTVKKSTPGDNYQRPDVAFFPADPDFDRASLIGSFGMGEEAYKKLGDQYDDHNALEIVRHRHEQGLSTLIPTLHLNDVFDTAMSHNRLFTLTEGDPEFAAINDVVINPMMSHLQLYGADVIRVLTYSGNADNALPKDRALEHGMLSEDAEILERFYMLALAQRLGNRKRTGAGVATHWALTGTRAMDILTADGESAKCVDDAKVARVASIIVNRTAVAIPVPMVVELGNCEVEVLQPRTLESVEDVHNMMREMTEAVTDLSGQKIVYGLPQGAVVIKKENGS